MTNLTFLGETRSEAINKVQETLGPATLRPLAERTFWVLAKKGKIIMDSEGNYLITEEINKKEELQSTALQIIKEDNTKERSKSNMRHFVIDNRHTHHAQINGFQKFMKALRTANAPSLGQAEGVDAPLVEKLKLEIPLEKEK